MQHPKFECGEKTIEIRIQTGRNPNSRDFASLVFDRHFDILPEKTANDGLGDRKPALWRGSERDLSQTDQAKSIFARRNGSEDMPTQGPWRIAPRRVAAAQL